MGHAPNVPRTGLGVVPFRAVWEIRRVQRSMLACVVALALAGCSDAGAASVTPPSAAPTPSEEIAMESAASASSAPAGSSGAPAAESSEKQGLVRKAPSVRVRKADAGPKGDAEALKRAIDARVEPLLACYEDARKIDRTLMGRVLTSFTLTTSGAAEKVKTSGDLPEALRACVVAQLHAASLPRPREDAPASFIVEFEPGRVHLRLHGKPYYDATGEDVKAALASLGCTRIKDESKRDNPKRYSAMLDGKHVRVTFTPKTSPSNPGAFHMSPRQIQALRDKAAVFQATDFVLAIRIEEDADTNAAAALLSRIVTEI